MDGTLICNGTLEGAEDDLKMIASIIADVYEELGYRVILKNGDPFVIPKNAETGAEESSKQYQIVWDQSVQAPDETWYFTSPLTDPKYLNYRARGIAKGHAWKTNEIPKPEEWNVSGD